MEAGRGTCVHAELCWAIGLATAAGAGVAVIAGAVGPIPLIGVLTYVSATLLAYVAWKSLLGRSVVGIILVYGFLVIGVLASIFYHPNATELAGVNQHVARMSIAVHGYVYLKYFLVAAFASWIGAMAATQGQRRSPLLAPGNPLRLPSWLLPVAAIPLLNSVYGIGLSTLLHAEQYLEHSGPPLAVKLGQATGVVGILICAYFLFKRDETQARRIFAGILALAYEAVYLGYGSRTFALWVPLMFVGGILADAWNVQAIRRLSVVVAILTIVALQVILAVRSEHERGLLPALTYISESPTAAAAPHGRPFNNVLFGAPLTVFIAREVPRLPLDDFKTELNPLPATGSSWSELRHQLRVNDHVPYSALGELANQSWILYCLVVAVIACGFGVAERLCARMVGPIGSVGYLVTFGTAALFVVESTEYPLRTSARLLYDTLIIVCGLLLAQSLPSRRRVAATPRGIHG